MSTRADRKADYQAYRKVAAQAIHDGNTGGNSDITVSVDSHAGVSLCEDGAYVDAVIWVPRRVMEESR